MSVENTVTTNNVSPVPSREYIAAVVRERVAEGARMCGTVTMKSVAKNPDDRPESGVTPIAEDATVDDVAPTVIELPDGRTYVIESPWNTAWTDSSDRAGLPA